MFLFLIVEILASYNDYNIFLFKNAIDDQSTTEPIQEYEGHRNSQTIKGVNFYGPHSEFVVSGCDTGAVFFWDKTTARIVHFLDGDSIGAVSGPKKNSFFQIFFLKQIKSNQK